MEEQEEKKTKRSCRDKRSQPNHIPLDLALEILSRLPAKSIVRYRCVSKLWSASTTLPSFINSFTSRSTSRSPTLMVTLSLESTKYVLFFPTHQIPDGSTYSPLYSYEITNLDRPYWRSESIQGLILSSVFKIWNPTLRQILALPHPPGKHSSSPNNWSSYLGYDPLEGKHKVLCVLSKKYSDQPLILTLGGQESWRTIPKGRCPVHLPAGTRGRCFNGILYYTARLGGEPDILMSFDVKSENFNPIKFPDGHSVCPLFIIPYEGRVAFVAHYHPFDVVELYILEDAHGHEWTRFVLHAPCKSIRRGSLRFRGTTDAGEFIFAPNNFYQYSYFLFFDPRRNSSRKVFFERNLDEFRRRCGLHRSQAFSMDVFPNHIESLFAL